MSEADRVPLSNLPTLAEMRARPRAQPKGQSRIEAKVEKDKSGEKAAEAYRAEVWKRDGGRCRCCGRVVVKSLELRPDRGEVHHLTRRAKVKALLTDPRNGILVCLLPCHQGLTHHEISIVGKAADMFELAGTKFLDASSRRLKFIKKEGVK
jgi:hypothetical protein